LSRTPVHCSRRQARRPSARAAALARGRTRHRAHRRLAAGFTMRKAASRQHIAAARRQQDGARFQHRRGCFAASSKRCSNSSSTKCRRQPGPLASAAACRRLSKLSSSSAGGADPAAFAVALAPQRLGVGQAIVHRGRRQPGRGLDIDRGQRQTPGRGGTRPERPDRSATGSETRGRCPPAQADKQHSRPTRRARTACSFRFLPFSPVARQSRPHPVPAAKHHRGRTTAFADCFPDRRESATTAASCPPAPLSGRLRCGRVLAVSSSPAPAGNLLKTPRQRTHGSSPGRAFPPPAARLRPPSFRHGQGSAAGRAGSLSDSASFSRRHDHRHLAQALGCRRQVVDGAREVLHVFVIKQLAQANRHGADLADDVAGLFTERVEQRRLQRDARRLAIPCRRAASAEEPSSSICT
jgi:hypothetical protein